MPNTPRVDFNFQNNNVGGASVPQLGISKVLARTTKGPFNDGSNLIRSYSQFQRIYGEEVVPDGSISNIRKALEGGSQLRIFRVAGANDPKYGYAYPQNAATENYKVVEGNFTSDDYTVASPNAKLGFSYKLTPNKSNNTLKVEVKLDEPYLASEIQKFKVNMVMIGEMLLDPEIEGENVIGYSGEESYNYWDESDAYIGFTITYMDNPVVDETNRKPIQWVLEVITPVSSVIKFKLEDPDNAIENYAEVSMNIRTLEQGSAILDNSLTGMDRVFHLAFSPNTAVANGANLPSLRVSLIQFTKFSDPENNVIDTNSILASNIMWSGSNNLNSTNNNIKPFVEGQVFQDFINNVPNITFEYVQGSAVGFGTAAGIESKIHDINGVINLLKTFPNWRGHIYIDETEILNSVNYLDMNEGNNGGDSDADTWMDAYNSSKDYVDSYQIICSHISQHLPEDFGNVLNQIGAECTNNYEEILFVEIPKLQASGEPYADLQGLVSRVQQIQSQVGNSKLIAYFGGGLKYYDNNGLLQDCDVLGTVLGLADTCATAYGPWYSFAGMNRGVVANAIGPVIENYGSPSRIDSLQELAENFLNLFVIKDTRGSGKQTMLWHSFTSTPYTDSERFLSIVRLNLYLKKNLRPILESYLEEPNIWDTWLSIYYQVLPILEDLVNRNAMSEFHWNGDQFAKSYEDLQVNTEAEVRQGKYKVNLVYKDIVTMQEISMNIIIDAASNSVNIETEE